MTVEQRAAKSSRKIICGFLDRVKVDGKFRSASSSRITKACGVVGLGDLLKAMVKEKLIEAGKMVNGTEYISIDGWASKLDLLYYDEMPSE